MILADVMTEAAGVLATITGLRVTDYPPETLSAPGGFVSYPRSIDMDETYGRGEDQFTDLPFVLVAGKATARAARDTVSAWTAGEGPESVKARMEAHAWQSCDDLTVHTVEFDIERIGGVSYLAALFKATVAGPGNG
jgi:hypothetical protein